MSTSRPLTGHDRSRHQATVLLWLLFMSLPLAAQEFTLPQLMQGLAAAEHPPRHFTEQRYSELLNAPLTLHGTLDYRQDRLVKHIQQPFDQRFTIKGEALTIERAGGEPGQQILLADYPPLLTFVTIFRATLQGDLNTLQQHYLTELSGGAAAWRLQLRPRHASVAVHIKGVEIAGQQSQISRFIVTEQSGDSSTLELEPGTP